MDQANVAEPVDLGPAWANTVAVLKAKASEKSVAVTRNWRLKLAKGRALPVN